jgi:hypothetical protein
MPKILQVKKSIFIFGIPMLIIGVLILLTQSTVFKSHTDSLAIAITFDLLLTVPFVYFLLIRKTNIPKTTVVPLLIFGMVVCTFVLPTENQYYLSLFKTWVFPVIEISIISFVIYKVRKAIKGYKANKEVSVDFFTTLKNTCYELLPNKAVIPVVTEIAVFYYGFMYWRKRELEKNEFSYHKNSGTITLLVAIIGIVAIETVVLHILLAKWSNLAAWILTFLSIYSGLQLFGFLKSMLKRPISIENNQLHLRYGIMTETTIDIKNIDCVEISSKDIEINNETRKLSFLGELESHNVIIRLKEENQLIGLYGIKKTYKNIALYVDDKVAFKNQIENTQNS